MRDLAVVLLSLIACMGISLPGVAAANLTVRAPAGTVVGIQRTGVREFLGIPYAVPPVGALRWQPPRPLTRWKKTLLANAPPNACPQNSPNPFAAPSSAEDCLYLNVFTPDGPASTVRRLPVMVWLHGGGLFSGSSADYEGSGLAAQGHVVLVTLNYRLGALGFLSHPALNAEGHKAINYGLMDQQLALRWVRKNIGAFGGDPSNVTLFGQSGGATAVMANLTSHAAKGLFRRVIIQSGTRVVPLPASAAVQQGITLAAEAGCPDQSAACLRSLSVEQILNHQQELATQIATHYPTLDGQLLTLDPMTAFRAGEINARAVMNGLVADEQAYFLPEPVRGTVLTEKAYEAWAREVGGADAEWILRQYPVATYGSPSLAEIAAAQDSKRCVVRVLDETWAAHVPVYAYEFADRSAPSYYGRLSYPMGAFHTSELQYLFPLFHGGRGERHSLSAQQSRTAALLTELWSSFARTGVPAAPAFNGWPAFDAASGTVLIVGPDAAVSQRRSETADESHCDVWNRIDSRMLIGRAENLGAR